MFIKGRETPMTKNEIAKSEKTMFPDILKKRSEERRVGKECRL